MIGRHLGEFEVTFDLLRLLLGWDEKVKIISVHCDSKGCAYGKFSVFTEYEKLPAVREGGAIQKFALSEIQDKEKPQFDYKRE